MTRRALSIALAMILSGGSVAAQVASPLGATSPLGLGVGSPIAPTGIPMGATELATPGVSPMAIEASPMGATSVMPPCPAPDAVDGTTAMAIFDGGGVTTTTMATCPVTASVPATNPAASSSSPMGLGSMAGVGRPGIPLGSVELGGGGLSPLPDPTSMMVPMVTPAAPMFALPPAAMPAALPATAAGIDCPIMSTPSRGASTAPGGC